MKRAFVVLIFLVSLLCVMPLVTKAQDIPVPPPPTSSFDWSQYYPRVEPRSTVTPSPPSPAPSASPIPVGDFNQAYATLQGLISALTGIGQNSFDGATGTGAQASALTAALIGLEVGLSFIVFMLRFEPIDMWLSLRASGATILKGLFLLVAIQSMPLIANTLFALPCYGANQLATSVGAVPTDCSSAQSNDFSIMNQGVQNASALLNVEMRGDSKIPPPKIPAPWDIWGMTTDTVGPLVAGLITPVSALIVLAAYVLLNLGDIAAKLALHAFCFIGILRMPLVIMRSIPRGLAEDDGTGPIKGAITTAFGLFGLQLSYALGNTLLNGYFQNLQQNGATLADLMVAPFMPIVWIALSAILFWVAAKVFKGTGLSLDNLASGVLRTGLGAGLNLATGAVGAGVALGKLGIGELAHKIASKKGPSDPSVRAQTVDDEVLEAQYRDIGPHVQHRPALPSGGDESGGALRNLPPAPQPSGGGMLELPAPPPERKREAGVTSPEASSGDVQTRTEATTSPVGASGHADPVTESPSDRVDVALSGGRVVSASTPAQTTSSRPGVERNAGIAKRITSDATARERGKTLPQPATIPATVTENVSPGQNASRAQHGQTVETRASNHLGADVADITSAANPQIHARTTTPAEASNGRRDAGSFTDTAADGLASSPPPISVDSSGVAQRTAPSSDLATLTDVGHEPSTLATVSASSADALQTATTRSVGDTSGQFTEGPSPTRPVSKPRYVPQATVEDLQTPTTAQPKSDRRAERARLIEEAKRHFHGGILSAAATTVEGAHDIIGQITGAKKPENFLSDPLGHGRAARQNLPELSPMHGADPETVGESWRTYVLGGPDAIRSLQAQRKARRRGASS